MLRATTLTLLFALACSEGSEAPTASTGAAEDSSSRESTSPAGSSTPSGTSADSPSTVPASSTEVTSADGTTVTSQTGSPGSSHSGTSESSDALESSSTSDSSTDTGETTPSAPMRGAVSLHVEPLGDCSLGDAWFDYPIVEGGHPVTATEHTTLSEDRGPGVPGMPLHVTCEWLTMGIPYRLGLGIDAYLDGDRRTASLSPVLEPAKPNIGSFAFSTTDGGPSWNPTDSEHRCEYTLIEMDESKQSIWGRITCPSLTYKNGTDTCQITEGYFYFENCRPRML